MWGQNSFVQRVEMSSKKFPHHSARNVALEASSPVECPGRMTALRVDTHCDSAGREAITSGIVPIADYGLTILVCKLIGRLAGLERVDVLQSVGAVLYFL